MDEASQPVKQEMAGNPKIVQVGHPTRWKPGQSGNPAGRKPTGLAFAERVREKVDPDIVIDAALKILRTAEKESDRLAAATFLRDSGWVKPPVQLSIEAHGQVQSYSLAHLTMSEQSEILSALQRARQLSAEGVAALPPGDDDAGGG